MLLQVVLTSKMLGLVVLFVQEVLQKVRGFVSKLVLVINFIWFCCTKYYSNSSVSKIVKLANSALF